MRKAYLKLSRKIHPDKHGGSAEAKRAKDDILLLNMKYCNANGIAIADTEDYNTDNTKNSY